jgi:hypothetical protein
MWLSAEHLQVSLSIKPSKVMETKKVVFRKDYVIDAHRKVYLRYPIHMLEV